MVASRMLPVLCSTCVLLLLPVLASVSAAARRDHHTEEQASPDRSALHKLAEVLGVPAAVVSGGRHGGRAPTPRYMLRLYDRVADGSGRARRPIPYGADTVRCLQPTGESTASTLVFAAPRGWPAERLVEAELHVHVARPPPGRNHSRHRPPHRQLLVYQLASDGARQLVDSAHVRRAVGRHVLHVRSALPPAAADDASLRLQLAERAAGGQLRWLSVAGGGGGGRHQRHRRPLLVLFSRDNLTHSADDQLVRTARSAAAGQLQQLRRPRRDAAAGCQRQPLYIDFKKIGWSEFVVAPTGYDAFQCVGRCAFPLTPELRPSNHATVQSLAHRLGMSERVQPPCCVPSSLSSLTVLFSGDDNMVVMKKYTDMVADQCGCH